MVVVVEVEAVVGATAAVVEVVMEVVVVVVVVEERVRHRRWWLCCRWWRRHGLVPVFARPLPVAHGRVTPDADGVATLSQSPPKTCSRIIRARSAVSLFQTTTFPRLVFCRVSKSVFVAQISTLDSRGGVRERAWKLRPPDVLDFDHVYLHFVRCCKSVVGSRTNPTCG